MAQKKGQGKIDSLIFLIKNYIPACKQPCIQDSVKVKNLNALAFEFSSGNLDSAILLNRQALALADKINWGIGMGMGNYYLGRVFLAKGDFSLALDFLSKALGVWNSLEKNVSKELMSTIKDKKMITLSNMGIVYFQKGDYTTANTFHYQSLKIAEELNNKSGMAKGFGNIGLIFRRLGNNERAFDYYSKALKMNEVLNDKNGMAVNLSNMGSIYSIEHEYIKALDHFQQSLKLYREIDNKIGIGRLTGNIGTVYDDQGDAYTLKGDTLLANDSYQKAINYYKQALKTQEESGDKVNMTINLGNIGSVLTDLKNYNEAEKYLQRSLKLAEEINSLDDIETGNENLRQFYTAKGDYKKAVEYYTKEVAIKDSLFNRDRVEEATRKEMTYEFDKRKDSLKSEQEKRLALSELQKRNALNEAERKRLFEETENTFLIQQAEDKRRLAESEQQRTLTETEKKIALKEAERKGIAAESEKTKLKTKAEINQQKLIRNSIAAGAAILLLSSFFIFLFYKRKRDAVQKQKETALNLQVLETEMKALRSQMNPHFIFNALQSIQTFLMNHKPEEANTYLLKFSKLMRLVLENSQYPEVPVKEDIQALELYMQLESIRLPHPFTYKIHIDNNVDPESDTILPLILQPFVENAIWHGLQYKPTSGHIEIFLSKRENMLYTTVTDDGVGRSNAQRNFKPIFAKHESLGIKLTQDRLNILNETRHVDANFTITDLFNEKHEPTGTKVELSLPLGR